VTDERKDVWAAGKLYEPYVGRWSRLVAKDLLTWLDIGSQQDWLDVGCGTGALSETILQHAQPRSVKGIDPSAGFVEYAKAHVHNPAASFEVGDAQSLPVADKEFDVAVAALVLNFVPQPSRALAEMSRVVPAGGIVAAYVWDYAGKMELMRCFWTAARDLDLAAIELDEGRRFPMCHPTPLAELFIQAGLQSVDVTAIDVPTRFRDFDDYWSPFLGGQGPAPGYAMSLSEGRREELRDHIRASLPVERDGSINFIARAWAVRGQVPE
jgi:SAM-dependent methyltransferase